MKFRQTKPHNSPMGRLPSQVEATPLCSRPVPLCSATTEHVTWTAVGCALGEEEML